MQLPTQGWSRLTHEAGTEAAAPNARGLEWGLF